MSHDRTQKEVTRVLDGRVVVILDPNKVKEEQDILRAHRSREKRYAFDRVFNPQENNLEVYQNTTRYGREGEARRECVATHRRR